MSIISPTSNAGLTPPAAYNKTKDTFCKFNSGYFKSKIAVTLDTISLFTPNAHSFKFKTDLIEWNKAK